MHNRVKHGFIVLTIKFHKEDDQRVAVCEELGTAIQADSIEEAQDVILCTVQDHLKFLEETGERERFFIENDISIISTEPREMKTTVELPTTFQRQTFSQHFALAI